MIAVIDYDTGNLCSVANALKRLGVEYHITADPSKSGQPIGYCFQGLAKPPALCKSYENGDWSR